MLSLVAYGSSDDESETEDDVSNVAQASKPKPIGPAGTEALPNGSGDGCPPTADGPEGDIIEDSQAGSNNSASEEAESSSCKELFSKLPAPSSKADFISGGSITSKRKPGSKGPVRILVPSLPEVILLCFVPS